MKIKLFPEKAQFSPDEPILLRARLSNFPADAAVRLSVFHFGKPVLSQERPAAPEVKFRFCPQGSLRMMQGFLARAELLCGGTVRACAYTACDRAESWKAAPRYGFLSDFQESEKDDTRDVESMNRLHLNVIQFYDWMYRHDDFFPPESTFQDIMGKTSSMDTVGRKISALHRYGMKAIAYGAVYGAESYFSAHPECALYDARKEPMKFIDRIYMMNIARGSGWHDHILGEYRKAVRFGFDGIHMDQYGFPKEAYTKENDGFHIRRLRGNFRDLIDDAKDALPESGIIFNAVNAWPLGETAKAQEDCVYIEVWPPNDSYADLNRLISDAKKYAPEKQVILAAYLHPFAECTGPEDYGCTAQLAMAVIFSSGGFHLLLGEDGGMLTQAYYPEYCRLKGTEFPAMLQSYYDFITAYEELLFGPDLIDITRTAADGINTDFRFSGGEFSSLPQSGHIWTQIRCNTDSVVIHLVNFTGIKNMNWNEAHPESPAAVRGVTVEAQILENPVAVRLASPDFGHGMCRTLEYTREIDQNGNPVLRFTVPELYVWDVIFIRTST